MEMTQVNKLIALAVARVKRPGYHADGEGLLLQVSRTGTKSWIFRYTLNAKRHEMGLGSCRIVDLATARELARACRRRLQEGADPLADRRAVQAARTAASARRMTFDQCAAAYIQAHRSEWRNPKHIAQWESTIAAYASPVIGTLPVADVDTDLVVKVLGPIWNVKTETATRLRGRIENILDWATVSKFRHGENPARWRGHLDNLLANPNNVALVRNHPALPWREIGAFMVELRRCEGVAAQAARFAILTAARSGEVRGARWDEIDLVEKLWIVPAARIKAGKEHRVPLSTVSMALLAGLPRRCDLLFPGRKDQAL